MKIVKSVAEVVIGLAVMILGFLLMAGGFAALIKAFADAGPEVPVKSLTLGPTAILVGIGLWISLVAWGESHDKTDRSNG
ncbi:MAG TPA: hypothetical protein VLE51_03160 [Candidatus Saccharimonadales bacterium]|nr:hypothetical protein [Candidatus Saccharimonadales bacterium]